MVVVWDCRVPDRLSSASLPGVPTTTSGLFSFNASACTAPGLVMLCHGTYCVGYSCVIHLNLLGWYVTQVSRSPRCAQLSLHTFLARAEFRLMLCMTHAVRAIAQRTTYLTFVRHKA